MIEFGISFIEFVLATFAPIYVGMFTLVALSRATQIRTRYFFAYALGLLFWFFFDTLNDAVQLDVNQGYNLDSGHIALITLFLTGFLLFTLVVCALLSKSPNSGARFETSLPLVILVALAMGIHGIGEGISFGGLAAGTQASSVLDAIGGIGGGIAYVFHKLLESTIVIVVFIAATRSNGLPLHRQLWQIIPVGLAFAIPSAVGEVVGYFVPVDSSWFYALGAGATLFVVLQVVRPIFATERAEELTYREYGKISIAMILGFLLLYAAALFHS